MRSRHHNAKNRGEDSSASPYGNLKRLRPRTALEAAGAGRPHAPSHRGALGEDLAHFQRAVGERPPYAAGHAEGAGRGAVVNEQTGLMSVTTGEDDGAIVISGACIKS